MRAPVFASKLRRRRRLSADVLEDRQLLATLVVNTTLDDSTVVSALSLREAIEVSDGTLSVSSLSTEQQAQVSGAVGSTNTIDFNIPSSDPGYNASTGVWTIAPQSELPTVNTNAAIINGYSQPGASKNTLAQGDNAKLAIAINGAGLGTISGLTIDSEFTKVQGLDIENFSGGLDTENTGVAGIVIAAANVAVDGCFIGTGPTGETIAPNGNGVVIESSGDNIGSGLAADRNIVSGNIPDQGVGYGIYVPDQADNPLGVTPSANEAQNNYIGVDATGTKPLGNGLAGVGDFGSGDTYGAVGSGDAGNVISGNAGDGIDSTGSITIEGNEIGTDETGNAGDGNNGSGISIVEAANAAISATIEFNVISGNTGYGIWITPGSPSQSQSQSQYTIEDNKIGTNRAGTAAIGNFQAGLGLYSLENSTISDNVISGNSAGLSLVTEAGSGPDAYVQHDVIQGNKIGTDVTGTIALPNTEWGILLVGAVDNMIGGTGTGQGNVIAFNGGDAIELSKGQQNQVTQNSIFGNGGAGINLVSGANPSVTPPVMTFTPGAGSTGTLAGTLTASPNLSYIVEIFSNPSAPVAGHEQGETFLRDVTVNTDGSGNGSFSLTEPDAFYTATATDPSGDTSAFSNAAGIGLLSASVTVVSPSSNPASEGQPVTFTAVVTAPGYQGTPTGTVTFTIDGQPQSPVPLSVVGGVDEAQFVATSLTAGQHSVTAAYSGDANVSGSSGSLPTETVTAPGLHSTLTTLSSSLDPSTVGQSVTFTAVVSPGATAGTPTGTVVFAIDGVSQPAVPLTIVNGRDEATFSIASLTKGSHAITAAYSGDSSFAASAVTSPLVQTVSAVTPPRVDGPTIEMVQRFGIHMQPTVLVISFNDPLEPASAVTLNNYKITDPSGHSVGILSAVFDAETNTVTLRPAERINLHETYRLTVIGTGADGVRNTQGILLDGADKGTPDSNYHGKLDWRNVVLTPAELRKYVHPSQARPAGALNHRFLHRSH